MDLLQRLEDETNLKDSASKWMKTLNNRFRKCFKKIKLGITYINVELESLFKNKEEVITSLSKTEDLDMVDSFKNELEEINEGIASICTKKNK